MIGGLGLESIGSQMEVWSNLCKDYNEDGVYLEASMPNPNAGMRNGVSGV